MVRHKGGGGGSRGKSAGGIGIILVRLERRASQMGADCFKRALGFREGIGFAGPPQMVHRAGKIGQGDKDQKHDGQRGHHLHQRESGARLRAAWGKRPHKSGPRPARPGG